MSTAVPVIEIPSFYVVDSTTASAPVKESSEFRNYCVDCHTQIGDDDCICNDCAGQPRTAPEPVTAPAWTYYDDGKTPAEDEGPKSVFDAFENYEGYYRIGRVLGSFAIALAILMHGLMSVNPQCTMPQQRHYRAQPF